MKTVALSSLLLMATLTCTLTSCGDKNGAATSGGSGSKADGTEAGAKQLLAGFVKPGADVKSLSASLRPSKADYEAVFSSEFAAKAAALYDPAWDAGKLVLAPKEGQTEVILHGVPTADIKAWSQNASDDLPGGYKTIKDEFKGGNTVYAFKFVKPGETLGMAFDGLVFVNGHWIVVPKPFRAAN
ncbi:MAG TPA: hypothetical protein VHM91_10980 [Verrucomicrobiales bacterium]|nr:hypothetical protein [Verrucomicrobiales bacterium]